MKSYPSIIGAAKYPPKKNLYTFDKLDGSNLRFEWSKKKGWFKFGTRKRLFDETDKVFGEAVPLFKAKLADRLEKVIVKNNWDRVIFFCEFWGENSFAGFHDPSDDKYLTVIDVSPYKKGLLPPKEFLKLFEEFGPKYLGLNKWNYRFIEDVRGSRIEGITFEGVVGKAQEGRKIVMYKMKTKNWADKIRLIKGNREADKIVEDGEI